MHTLTNVVQIFMKMRSGSKKILQNICRDLRQHFLPVNCENFCSFDDLVIRCNEK